MDRAKATPTHQIVHQRFQLRLGIAVILFQALFGAAFQNGAFIDQRIHACFTLLVGNPVELQELLEFEPLFPLGRLKFIALGAIRLATIQ